jgi:hypothetical protein
LSDYVDLSAVQAAPDPEVELIEPGTYPVTIIEASHAVSAVKGTPCIKIKCEVATGTSKGRVLFDSWWLTPGAKGMLIGRFKSVGLDLNALPPSFAPASLIGRRALVQVEHEEYVTDAGMTGKSARLKRWNADPAAGNDTSVASDPLAPVAPSEDLPW